MSSVVHYRFNNDKELNTINFEGSYITAGDLKRQIILAKNFGKQTDDLKLTDSSTGLVFPSADTLIPKNSTVIASRIPVERNYLHPVKGDANLSIPFGSHGSYGSSFHSEQHHGPRDLSNVGDLAGATGTEDEKLMAAMNQSAFPFSQRPMRQFHHHQRGDPIICHACGESGHIRPNCPKVAAGLIPPRFGPYGHPNPAYEKVRRGAGIPREFMKDVSGPQPGAYLVGPGQYAVPIMDDEAFRVGKTERRPLAVDQSENLVQNEPKIDLSKLPPLELTCGICKNLMTDAVVIPCCGNAFCDECIRTKLLESENLRCPTCFKEEVSPDSLIAIKPLRDAVENFRAGLSASNSPAPTPTVEDTTEEEKNEVETGASATDAKVEQPALVQQQSSGPEVVPPESTSSESPEKRPLEPVSVEPPPPPQHVMAKQGGLDFLTAELNRLQQAGGIKQPTAVVPPYHVAPAPPVSSAPQSLSSFFQPLSNRPPPLPNMAAGAPIFAHGPGPMGNPFMMPPFSL